MVSVDVKHHVYLLTKQTVIFYILSLICHLTSEDNKNQRMNNNKNCLLFVCACFALCLCMGYFFVDLTGKKGLLRRVLKRAFAE